MGLGTLVLLLSCPITMKKKNEAQRYEITCPSPTVGKWQDQDLSSGSLSSVALFLTPSPIIFFPQIALYQFG